MKMYKKSQLELVDGMLVANGEDVVAIDISIVSEANMLETMVQKAAYLKAQPEAQPMPSLDGFERKSIDDVEDLSFEVSTPALDFAMHESLKMMDELDAMNTASQANQTLKEISNLVSFVKGDNVVSVDNMPIMKFDTPTLGSVLDLTVHDLVQYVGAVCGLEPCDEGDDEE